MIKVTADPRDDIRAQLKLYFNGRIEGILGQTIGDTPIENILFVALSAVCEATKLHLHRHKKGLLSGCETFDDTFNYWRRHRGPVLILFEDQAQIGPYRVDFLFGAAPFGHARTLVVECDGHDFHNVTKEQASKDRERDRYLQSHGFRVFRFTGSDIWRDPVKCAEQILEGLLYE